MKLTKNYLVAIATLIVFTSGLTLGVLLGRGNGLAKILNRLSGGDRPTVSAIPGSMPSAVPASYQGKLQLFVLAGQSNMAGMGKVSQANTETNPNIYVFGNDYRWKLAKEPVDDPTDQVDSVSEDRPAGVGPSMAFATTVLAERSGMLIGLIPCAKGGSSIQEWQRNLDENTLYGSCLKRVRAASVMGNVAGFLYFQGEIDTINPQEFPGRPLLPHQWAEKFTALVKDWRSDLGLPRLPVVFAQIGSNTEPQRFVNWSVVKEQQRQVRLPFATMITTDDLELQDYVHFTTASYQTIGQRFARAYLGLTKEMEQPRHPVEQLPR